MVGLRQSWFQIPVKHAQKMGPTSGPILSCFGRETEADGAHHIGEGVDFGAEAGVREDRGHALNDCDMPMASRFPASRQGLSVTPLRYGAAMATNHSTTSSTIDPNREAVHVEAGAVVIHSVSSDDPTIATILARTAAEDRPELVRRMLGIGARAMVETSIGVDLAAIDQRVLHTIEKATAAAETQVRTIVGEAETIMRSCLDPDARTSVMARAITEFHAVRSSISDCVDPSRADSHVARLLGSLATMLGPGGDLERRLAAALDPTNDESNLGGLRKDMERQFAEIRELLAEQRGRRSEAEAGTRKGFEFEDVLESRLRTLARPLGAVVSRTADVVGAVGDSLVGDFVVTLPSGASVVVEVKNSNRIGLDGAGGILSELDRAILNRDATYAICVSALDAYPSEVGTFGVYGNRVLVVDDGEGSMIDVAFRWVGLVASMTENASQEVDVARLSEVADRVRRLARSFSSHRRALTDSIESIGRVREGLDDMRRDLLAQMDDMEFELTRDSASRALRAVNGQ